MHCVVAMTLNRPGHPTRSSITDFAQGFAILTWVSSFPQHVESGQKAAGAMPVDPNQKQVHMPEKQISVQA
jgi:hypothetical protein